MKTKSSGRVEDVKDGNIELTVRDDFFQLGELVDPYQVTSSNDLEENSFFYINDNIFVNVDVEKLNGVGAPLDIHKSMKMMITMKLT